MRTSKHFLGKSVQKEGCGGKSAQKEGSGGKKHKKRGVEKKA
jgi:hypothetical protein